MGNIFSQLHLARKKSDPIAIVSNDSGLINHKSSLKQIRLTLKNHGRSDRTIRWHTFGLDPAECEFKAPSNHDNPIWGHWERWDAEQSMKRIGGLVCFSASRKLMRDVAMSIRRMSTSHHPMDYLYIGKQIHFYPEGEVQLFSNYRDRCSAAALARDRIKSENPEIISDEELYQKIAPLRDFYLRKRYRQIRARRSQPNNERRIPPTTEPELIRKGRLYNR